MNIARMVRFGSVGLLLALVAVPASSVAAQGGNGCPAGQSPHYVFGFAVLHNRLGPAVMGDPLTCEFPDPNGTGDVLQVTNHGLAFWRKSTNTPTFTDSWRHFALTPASPLTVVYWEGPSIDPPATARPPQGAAEYACDFALPPDLAALHNCP
jgi:hypothetical protein